MLGTRPGASGKGFVEVYRVDSGQSPARFALASSAEVDERYSLGDTGGLSEVVPGDLGQAGGGVGTPDYPGILMGDGAIFVRDLDADGANEVVALSLTINPATFEVSRELVLYRASGGALDVAGRTRIPMPSELGVRSFALAQVDADPALELALLGFDGVYLAELDAAAATIGAPRRIFELLEGSALGSGDFDGDGVTDLVVADLLGSRFWLGTPVIR
jgi:hypothetical protein